MHARTLVRIFVAVAGVASANACVTPGRDDLDVTLAKHHIDLRWGRLENAALVVREDLRGAFVRVWLQRLQDVELQDIEVAGVAMSDDGRKADVVVSVTWVERTTMSVHSSTLSEQWVADEQAGWRLVSEPAPL